MYDPVAGEKTEGTHHQRFLQNKLDEADSQVADRQI